MFSSVALCLPACSSDSRPDIETDVICPARIKEEIFLLGQHSSHELLIPEVWNCVYLSIMLVFNARRAIRAEQLRFLCANMINLKYCCPQSAAPGAPKAASSPGNSPYLPIRHFEPAASPTNRQHQVWWTAITSLSQQCWQCW